ncbi:sensor domain-containing diguanylate cyclase [Desulfovibrio subterraneus]|uniref:diguanylate cyclase n=1 Tax=Desulfovibrio subterraneus TaxID=2718620 RepID=A0A7J0BK49_9BACT|nr:sensor domain-containing diguanylate cyclase [Desulfovibrio subterraneus]GFM34086.1 GGDEF domain-containing protein [Desulfovibrio subterraneus]
MRGTNKKTMWGLGLLPDDAALIDSVGNTEFTLISLPSGTVPDAEAMDKDEPCILWISKTAWDEIKTLPHTATRHLDIIPRVLLLGGEYRMEELEEALDNGFTDVIKPPLTESRIKDVLMRTSETHNLYHDIMRMTREICLERELLERKNDILSFIVSFLSRATESLEPSEILQSAQEELATLLPIAAMGAICWAPGTGRDLDASLYISANDDHPARKEWENLLLGGAEKLSGRKVRNYTSEQIHCQEEADDLMPEPGKVAILPLKTAGETFGAVALLSRSDLHLGKDQVQILKSAMKHLALALKNAMLYRQMKQHADLDGLTLVHNRRHFDNRLKEEVDRHIRYSHPLSLLILDIDHFKQINDMHGHQAGDTVLKELAALLRSTLRTTDYVARYGGEEFTIILPHTQEEPAAQLAERLRITVADYTFMHEAVRIPITISIGLSSQKESTQLPADLILEADKALYRAKAQGRNKVCMPDYCLNKCSSAAI